MSAGAAVLRATASLVSMLPAGLGFAAILFDSDRRALHDRLAELHLSLCIEPDLIFVRDGHVYTSGGITSGIDLALALIEEDLGRDIAMAVARMMVVFLRRPGGQTHFSPFLYAEAKVRGDIRDLQTWILAHSAERLEGRSPGRRDGRIPSLPTPARSPA